MTVWRLAGLAVLAASCGRTMAQALDTGASDDVWDYGHSLNPAYDPLLRVWSDGLDPIHPCPPDDYHSYSYVKFHLTPTFAQAKTYKVTAATLTLTQQLAAGYTQDQANAAPLLAYSLADNWSEATWVFGTGPCPDLPKLGTGDMSFYDPAGGRFPIPIDLIAGGAQQFNDFFNQSLKAAGNLDFALCSMMAPGSESGTEFYKLISKDHASGLGPALHIVAQLATSVSGTVTLGDIAVAPTGVPVTFDVRQVGSTTALESYNVPLDSGGNYSFATAQTGKVDVAAKGSVWLRQVQTVDLGGATNAVNFSLAPGDADNNNAVNLKDLSVVLSNFGTHGPDGDLNIDGNVGIKDLSLILLDFNMTGNS